MISAHSIVLLVAVLLPISIMGTPQELTTSVNRFAGSLYHKIASGKNENLIMSPLSVQTILSLVSMGAGGNTAAQLSSGLHQTLSKEKTQDDYHNLMTTLNSQKGVTLNIANKVYAQVGYTLNPNFKEVATTKFLAGAENLDFGKSVESAKVVNTWVEQKTNEKIKDLIAPDDLSADTRMVLVNALYFKGDWEKQFNKDNTEEKPFYISETETKNVQMMHMKDKFLYGDFPELDAKAVQLKYKDSDLAMMIILPNSKTGLAALEDKLQTVALSDLISKMYSVDVVLDLPKFKIESEIDLNEPLKQLGMTDMFDAKKADFRGLLDSDEELYVSKVLQKAFIEVNEEGAEAAAATGVMLMTRCMPVTFHFKAEHPFLYFLGTFNRDNLVLFNGRLVKPN